MNSSRLRPILAYRLKRPLGAVEKREDTHKMAEAFAHYRW